MQNEMPDDLDQVYAKLEWENPPPNLSARVMARVRATQRVQRMSTLLSLVALFALGLFAFTLGRGLTLSGTLDYLLVLAANLDVAFDGTDEFVSALLDGIPWVEVGAVLLSGLGLWLASVALPRVLINRRSKAS
jgi:hypothetical protein